jgi:hypothetical protein
MQDQYAFTVNHSLRRRSSFSALLKDRRMTRRPQSAPHDWMEIIRIRMDHSMRTGIEAQIMGHLAEVHRSHDAPQVSVRRHLSVYNDLMIVLRWDTAPEPTGSSLAYSLCREFEIYGLVDHTVWGPDCFAGRYRSPHRDNFTTATFTSEEQLP